jgi:hypothetical protein
MVLQFEPALTASHGSVTKKTEMVAANFLLVLNPMFDLRRKHTGRPSLARERLGRSK